MARCAFPTPATSGVPTGIFNHFGPELAPSIGHFCVEVAPTRPKASKGARDGRPRFRVSQSVRNLKAYQG